MSYETLQSLPTNMQGIVVFNGDCSKPVNIRIGVKQVCVLSSKVFGIFFLLQHVFGNTCPYILLHSRSDGRLFNLACLKAKTKIRLVELRDFLLADDSAVVAYSFKDLQTLMNRYCSACNEFGFTISLKKTQVLTENAPKRPVIRTAGQAFDIVKDFTYLGSTI